MKILVPILTHSNSGEALFTPNGNILHVGDRFKNPAFADFLEELIIQGADYFYKGLGQEYILNTVGERGLLTADCLANYSVVERKPLPSHFNGKIIYTNPAPSVGGSLITFTLQLMERLNTVSPTKLINLIHADRKSVV